VRKSISIGLLLFLWFFRHGAYANEVTMFGPERYIRTSGQPNTYADSFSARAGSGRLIILNGNQSGSKRIDYAISSARVYLNGEEIFGPQNFNKNTYYLEASVNLSAENNISIELASSPDSYVTLQVIQEIDPPTVSISAVPETLISGEHTVLSWSSNDADSCIIEPGIGPVDPIGSVEISPTETTEYTITAANLGGTATDRVIITVYHIPTVDISAMPDTIIEGASSTLTWISTYAETVTIDNGIGTVDADGSLDVSPAETKTYTITATGFGGTSSKSTTLVVLHPPIASDKQISLQEDNAAGGTLTASDEDGDSLIFSMVSNGGKGTAVITEPSTGAFTYTPNPNANGTDFFAFLANDGLLDSNTATVTVEILPVNDAPEISGIPESAVYENKPYSFLPAAVDVDNDSLLFSIVKQPVWASFDTNTGLLSGTPTHAHVGTTIGIIITVSDGEFSSSLPAFDVTVIDPDVDKDGIEDMDEVNIYHTDPNALDTDNDGINDGDELAYWGENWNVDYDGDGLTNLIDADSDNDGMPDGWELQNGLDPSINDAGQDADGDGIVNSAEFKLNMNPNVLDDSIMVDVTYEYDERGSIKKVISVLKKP